MKSHSSTFEFQNESPLAGGPAQEISRSRSGHRFSSRRYLFLLALTGSITTCLAVGVFPEIREHPGWQTALFFLLLPLCLALTFTWPRTVAVRIQVVGILLFALVLRLALLPHPADSDVNRYLWEGRLVRAGVSPYSQVASARRGTMNLPLVFVAKFDGHAPECKKFEKNACTVSALCYFYAPFSPESDNGGFLARPITVRPAGRRINGRRRLQP